VAVGTLAAYLYSSFVTLWPELAARWDLLVQRVLDEAKSLVRVTRIDQPEAMLVAPEQAYFLRENIKLRLLNARLALLSRQFGTAQSDLREVQIALERHFDRSSRRVNAMNELLRQVSAADEASYCAV
jgi:uroporphyrin-3 C-methyltransferase